MISPLCLIIEDDFDASQIFSKILNRKGFDFEEIMDGKVALERLTQITPNLVLLDMHLPNASGIQILEFIRGQAHLARTAVVVISADYSMTRTIENEADFVMLKPINVPQLSGIIDRVAYQHNFIGR